MIVQAYADLKPNENSLTNVVIDNSIIDKIDLNLPPGILSEVGRKQELLSEEQLDNFNEIALLDTINKRLAPKFREMICK